MATPVSALVVFLLSLFILHSGLTTSVDPLNFEEKKALLTFITSVPNSHLFTWNPSEPACSWRGVTCNPDNTTVLYLRLPARNFLGEIPKNTIGRLLNLRVLSLRLNSFSGEIPSDISSLTYLTSLHLYDNNFSGQIPSGFSSLTYLTSLRLNNNSFSGQIPYITANNLRSFNVSFNRLNSSIPSSLSKFPPSAFAMNVYLCGAPLNVTCNSSYPPTYFINQQEEMLKDKREIVGVSFGSSLLLLILLCAVGKKIIYWQMKPQPSKASEMDRNRKLVLFEDGGFGLEDLLKTPTRVLGEGSVGTSVLLVGENTKMVVKRLKHVAVTDKEFETKMEVLGKMMRNKNVVPLRGFCNYSEDEKWIVYDYMPAGSLSAHLHGGSIGSARTQLDWDHRMRIALSAAKGLAYLHVAREVVHDNIKSSNIFLQQETNNEAALSDYGLNTLFRGSNSMNQVTGYWAPEVLEIRKFTFESDVYSFGVLLLEILTGKTPNQASLRKDGVHFSKLVESLVCEEPKIELFDVELTRDHNIDKMVQLLRIAKDCVSIVPNQRPPMRNVVSMMEEMLLRQSSDYHSKGYSDKTSMETPDTSSTITLDTSSTRRKPI
ncbi:hypothetical protein L1987_31099 [Smallanthus sonchifolius]|uniref:Uncharacterized protein n=1 Tax=Smallanthus sonchifolius TaxID=185202 RepID=A0ACB9I589_9ASTR|nr:hypothetical protein L1987_31099 [Smallanthus sonchifolius]